MWLVCALFALNTVGNLFALDLRETLNFTPNNLVGAPIAARVALGERFTCFFKRSSTRQSIRHRYFAA